MIRSKLLSMFVNMFNIMCVNGADEEQGHCRRIVKTVNVF